MFGSDANFVNLSVIQVKIHQNGVITNRLLKAEDLDSPNENLTFIVRQLPKFGYLQKMLPSGSLKNITLGKARRFKRQISKTNGHV